MDQRPTIVINTTPEDMTVREAAKFFGVGKTAIYEAINMKAVEAYKLPGAATTINVESFRQYKAKWRLK